MLISFARFVLVGSCLASFGLASAQSTETANVATNARRTTAASAPAFTVHNSGSTKAILVPFGPFVTQTGVGGGGANVSELYTTFTLGAVGYNIFGYGMASSLNIHVADDFTVPAAQSWTVSQVKWLSYQTGAATTGTITSLSLNLWNTNPNGQLPGGQSTTGGNQFQSNSFTGVYRVTDTGLTAINRAIIQVTCGGGWVPVLGPGTYWLEAFAGGTLTSGPWAPVKVVVGQTPPTGDPWNGLQSISAGAFAQVYDTGNPAGSINEPSDFLWQVEGTSGGSPPIVTSVSPPGGGEGTAISVTGSNFGTTPNDLKILLADGIGFADVISASGTSLTATAFHVGNTGTGPVTVIRGLGLAQPNQSSSVGGITSNSTLVHALISGVATNFGSFNLSPGSPNTASVSSGTPLPGGITLDMTGLGGAGLTNFCTSKTSSLGCVPTLTASSASASKSGAPAVTIAAGPVPGGSGLPGILIYSKTPPSAPILTSFGNLCLSGFARAGAFPDSPGGTPGTCTGNYTWNLSAIAAGSGNIAVGDVLRIQAWYRDPGHAPPGSANLTHGLDAVTIFSDGGTGLRYRLAIKSTSAVFAVYQGQIDFVGVPTVAQRAAHLADHLNQSFGSFGVSAGVSGTFVRVSMAGAAYGGIVVAGK